MRLFEKAKKLGVWNPSEIDLTQDVADWAQLTAEEQDILLRLMAMFQAGEEAVTLDLLPLILAIAGEGRLEEELFLTTFLFEEAKHVDFFNRVITAVTGPLPDLSGYHTANYRAIFYEALPKALNALRDAPSAENQVRAAVTYNMVVEGMLAETGYHSFLTVLEGHGLMPGVQRGIRLLKQDESRHIAYGIYLLSRLISAEPALWRTVEETMNDLFLPALGVVSDPFELYEPMPFGMVMEDYLDYAASQFNKRLARLEGARTATFAEIASLTEASIEAGDV